MLMPNIKCRGSTAGLHSIAGSQGEDETGFECEESDPSGRFIRYKEVLGRGAFKTVYRAFDEVDGIEVAWNQIRLQDALRTSEDLERLCSEVHLLKTLKHRNIIKFYHSWVDTIGKNINFITEIFTSGTLRQYRKKHRRVDIKAMKNWSRQILRGLVYLHSHDPPIIHRDLKCDNIFINGNQGEVKIGDLGLAATLRHANSAHSVIGTPEFMAPELYEEEYTELADIYSFGMCLLEMVTFEYPYSECTNAAQIYKKVTSGQKPAALNRVKVPELCEFIEKCLATASRRLSARELLMDPFLQCDGDLDPVECVHKLGTGGASLDDMDELEDFCSRAYFQTALGLGDEHLVKLPDQCDMPIQPVPTSPSSQTLRDRPALSDSKENKMVRHMGFKVKGKRRENDSVYLRLQITDSEGEVSNIHFPFDVEGDTAMCVASEMVAELDLADHDVTKIAEMIDAAILLMIPEWKPGVAIDEPAVVGEDRRPVYDDCYASSDHLSTVSSQNSLLSQCQHGWHVSAKSSPASENLTPQTENKMHGRFEEVTHHFHKRLENHCTTSVESSQELCDWEPGTDESGSPVSPCGLALEDESRTVAAPVDELAERGTESGTYRGQRADELREDSSGVSMTDVLYHEDEPMAAPTHFDGDDNVRDLVLQELKELGGRYQRELTELQQKHERALVALRRRWQVARSHFPSSSSRAKQKEDAEVLKNRGASSSEETKKIQEEGVSTAG